MLQDRPPDLPPAPELPVDTALVLLQAAAVPLMHVDAAGRVRWANDAAVQAAGARPGQAFSAGWADAGAAAALCAAAPGQADLQAAHPATAADAWFQVHSRPLAGGGWALTLLPLAAQRVMRAELAQKTEWLDLARGFGRLYLWERNVRTLTGHGDREVMRFWGVDPTQPNPHFSDAIKNVLEADREALNQCFNDSLKQAGRYATRYRMRAFDGTVRRVHSRWVVVNGVDSQPERVLGLMMDDTEPYALAASASESESQLALAVELGGIALWRHDLQTDRVHYNRHGWLALGLEPRVEGLTRVEVQALIHPDDLASVLASARAALNGDQPVDVEARFRHADGSWRPLLLRRTVLRDAAGQAMAFVGVGLDISERQAQRRRAEEMGRRFETATRAAGIGHWIHEAGQDRPFWSEQLRTLYGLDLQGPAPSMREWLDRYALPEDAPRIKDSMKSWLKSGHESLELNFRARRADGEVREIFSHSQLEASSHGTVLFGVVIDLTERRRSELALKGAQDRVALAARAAGLGTWEQDVASSAVLWDEQMWRLRGRTPMPVPMTPAERLACVHPQDRSRAERMTQDALTSGNVVEHEFRVLWPDGSVHWLASRSMDIHEADVEGGNRRRRIGVNWDVTAIRTADTVRREREIALRESASKSKFLARMSHELRTPLNAVLGFAQLLLSDEAGVDAASSSRRRRLEHIRSAGQHLLTLINDVLSLSALQGGEVIITLAPVDLQALVAQTLPMIAPLLQQQQVRIEQGALAQHVMADATRLRQVLLNLLSNALKYNRPGGTVHIEALRRGPSVLLRVTDTGCGMGDEQLRHLFEPFNRLGADRSEIEGTGIGLAIVKALVERMGGSVHVDSRAGVGTVFELRLAAALSPPSAPPSAPPSVSPSTPPSAQPPTSPPAPAQTGAHPASTAAPALAAAGVHRVLYIEDNPVNALIISEMVARRTDLSLLVATDGASGVRQAQELLPELILLDMQLPDFDGFEVLRQLRAEPRTAGIRCIALSANAMPADIQRALNAGLSDYWTKPLDLKAFMAALDALFGKAP